MGVPPSPATKLLLDQGLNVVGKVVKTSKYKFADWNIKLPKGTTKLPDAEFKKLSRAAQFFREGYYTTEDIKKIQDAAKEAKSKVKEAEKLAKESKNLWDKFLSGTKGASQVAKASAAGKTVIKAGDTLIKLAPVVTALFAVGLTLVVNEIQGWRNDVNEDGQQLLSQSISKVLGLMNVQQQRINRANEGVKKAELENQRVRDRIYGVEKQLPGIRESVAEAKKQANDALYETRRDRGKTDVQIAEAKKQANDALYETRQGRVKIDIQIAEAKKQANDALYETRQGRVKIDIQIAEAKKQANDAKLTGERISGAIESLKGKVADAVNTATKALIRADQLPKIIEGKPGKDGAPGKAGINGNPGKDGAPGKAGINGNPGKDGAPSKAGINGEPGKDGKDGIFGLNGKDGKDGKDGKPGKDLEMDEATKELIRKTAQNAAFIPALVARPVPLNADQTISAAAAGTCRTLQPGGCSAKALDGLGNGVNQNTNNQVDGLLNKLNAGANAAQLALLRVIDKKLGAQIPNGGISKFLNVFLDTFNNFTRWTRLDRLLNMLIFAATIQNHLMLSRDIGTTLIGAFTNILTLVGLKDSEGNSFNVQGVINTSVQNFVKSIIGAENYTILSENWAKANRIYQATTNVLNSFLSLSQTILQASELIAAHTGKIGNALKKGGVILESAYGWMNPQPKFNRVTKFLEGLQSGASTIQMVTQAPLDVVNATTEFTTASTEFVKAVKEDDKPENKATPIPEPNELKAKEAESKDNSQPLNFDFSDLFDGED